MAQLSTPRAIPVVRVRLAFMSTRNEKSPSHVDSHVLAYRSNLGVRSLSVSLPG